MVKLNTQQLYTIKKMVAFRCYCNQKFNLKYYFILIYNYRVIKQQLHYDKNNYSISQIMLTSTLQTFINTAHMNNDPYTFNPYNAEIFLYKLWRPTFFFFNLKSS